MNEVFKVDEIVGILIVLPHVGHILTICGCYLKSGNEGMKFNLRLNSHDFCRLVFFDEAGVIVNNGLAIVLMFHGVIGKGIKTLSRVTSEARNTSFPMIINLSNHLSSPYSSSRSSSSSSS